MQGEESDPGIVLQALGDIFAAIKRSQGKDHLLGLSMLEIYNEVNYFLLLTSMHGGACRRNVSSGSGGWARALFACLRPADLLCSFAGWLPIYC